MALPSLLIEAAFTTGANLGTALHLDDTTRGKLDTGTLAADETWTDITSYGRPLETFRGSTRVDSPILRYETGSASLALNNEDRRFDPTNDDGPYVGGGVTQVTPARAVRIRAVWAGVTYNLFRGFASQWDLEWDENWAETTVPCTDVFKILAGKKRAAVAAVGAGEDTGARVSRILDSAGWPAADRVISTGDSTLQATTLEGDALSELQLAADSEIGELYVDAAGRVVFRNRQALMEESRSNTSQATFGDLAGELRYAHKGLGISTDDSTQFNEVRITRSGGSEQVAQGAGPTDFDKTFERSDLLLETDEAAADYAAWLLHISKDYEVRFTSITINPLYDPDTLFPQVLGREIGDRITIRRRPPGGGDPIERQVFIRGIKHEIGLDTWLTTWTLQSATKVSSFLTLDNAVLGKLDSNALAF